VEIDPAKLRCRRVELVELKGKMPRKSRGLAEVTAAIDIGDTPGALALALAAWREARCTEMADLVDAIGARCHPAAIGGRGAAAFHKAWMQLAESKPSPVAVGALASTIGKNIPVVNTGRSYVDRDIRRFKAFLDRVAALAKLPHDPRIASGLCDVLERAPWSIESGRRIYQPAVDLVIVIADERSVARLQAIVERPTSKHALVRAYFADALPAAAKSIENYGARALPGETREAGRALIASLAEPPAPSRAPADLDRLWAECLAHPDDDGPRVVLADALLERGDPRGEFISLQLSSTLDDTQRKRAAALLRQHEKDWLGDLATVTKQRVWRRGFLEEAELARNASADTATWKRAAGDPRLATLRRLAKGASNEAHYEAFVLSPAMRALRDLEVRTAGLIEQLAELPRRIETMRFVMGLDPRVLAALIANNERIGVTRLAFAVTTDARSAIARLADTRFGELCARPATYQFVPWFEENEAKRWLTAHDTLGVRRLGVEFQGATIVVEPGPRIAIEPVGDDDDKWIEWVRARFKSSAQLTVRGVPVKTGRDRARRARRP
jgi:uncharacterized protein (TIGR02996 family)